MSETAKKEKKKIDLGPKIASYPMPVCLIGANLGSKANFLTAAWFMSASISPPRIAVALNKGHSTNKGIKEHAAVSVSIPSEDLINATDYCGLFSGSKTDKSAVFSVFYGKLGTAPMISECPVNMECKLEKVVDNGEHEMFIGEIVSTFTEEKYLTNRAVDLKKVKPFLLSFYDRQYLGIGESKARAWNAGNNYKR